MHSIKKHHKKNIILISASFLALFFGVIVLLVSTLQLPDFRSFTERKVANSTKIYDRTGEILLYDVHKDIRRTVISYEDMGVNIKNAVIAIEDSEFYVHKGIRIKAIIRVLVDRFLGKSNSGGGSTITQQLIKNTLLTQEKTISRKVKEWILAVKLERIMGKEDILALYLNEAPYGGTVYGIEEGSKMFFAKSPRELTLAEAAYLAAIPNSPTYYSPYRSHKKELDDRKNLVLKRMFDLGFINEDEYTKARNEVVEFQPEKPTNIAAPHFVFFVRDYLEKKYGADALDSMGLKVITTLDYELQKKAEEVVAIQAKENEKNAGGENAAAVVIDPNTGQILSMVGSRGYFDKEIDGNFNVTTAMRQPGSSFKPFIYALAFNKGYTDKTVLLDVPTQFSDSCDALGNPLRGNSRSECYMPNNYDNAFRGPLSLRDALAQSINIIAVKLLYLVGVQDSIKLAHDMGITSLNDPDRYGLSLVIGGGETSLLDMTSAYGVFATEGIRHPYASILSIEDKNGEVIEEYKNQEYSVLPANTTRMISDVLSDDNARIPTFGARSSLYVSGADTAAKTGTTNNNRDAWTIGYSPKVVVGVWVGNNDNTPMKKGGVALAGPIWNQIMTEAVKKNPGGNFNEPDPINPNLPPIIRGYWQGGETFITDSYSGKLATEFTPEGNRVETSITNVHTILYWIDKNNPTENKKPGPSSDSQFERWEYSVTKWWEQNKYKYKIITENDIPKSYDDVHTEDSKPEFKISGIDEDTSYAMDMRHTFIVSAKSSKEIKKVDVFINNIYLTSLKNLPSSFSVKPEDIDGIEKENTIRVIGQDISGNTGQTSVMFKVE